MTTARHTRHTSQTVLVHTLAHVYPLTNRPSTATTNRANTPLTLSPYDTITIYDFNLTAAH
jgi:hypothetical protein